MSGREAELRARVGKGSASAMLSAANDIQWLLARLDALQVELAEAALPLEVLRAQILAERYSELTPDFQDRIVAAAERVRAALASAETKEPR